MPSLRGLQTLVAIAETGSPRVRSVLSAAALASAGFRVTLVPRSGWLGTANGVAVSLDPPVARDVVAMHRTPVSPLVAAFCATVVRTVPLVVGHS